MRVGINALALSPGVVGGAETYIRGLLHGLERLNTGDEYIVFTNRDNHETFAVQDENFRRIRLNAPASWDIRSLIMTRVIGEQLWLPRIAARERVDVLHSPLDSIPLAARCATVMTLHDLNFEAFPETNNRAERSIARALVKASARRASAIITVSRFSHRTILNDLKVAPERLFMVHNGGPVPLAAHHSTNNGNWSACAARMGINGQYVLALSSLNSHKNIDTLIRAFGAVRAAQDCQLIVAGHLPKSKPTLPELSNSLGLGRKTIFTGYLDAEELRQLMRHARLFAFPSRYEGFGLPVIEAMSEGIPVISSNAAALPEIAADAAIFVDPLSPDQMTKAIERVLGDDALRQRLRAAGRRNAGRFSWERTAMLSSRVYRYAAGVRADPVEAGDGAALLGTQAKEMAEEETTGGRLVADGSE
jgi:glycosyltransferase involved in cell wall biosynthesis